MRKAPILKYFFIVIIFVCLIFSFRYIWLQHFSEVDKVHFKNGEVFLTEDVNLDDRVQLVGEWTFYPNELITEVPEKDSLPSTLLQVPGKWNHAFEGNDSKGYGTYHLRIHVQEDIEKSYSMRFYSVRSTSAVYVDGYNIGGSGKVSDQKESYDAFNVPFTTYSIHPDEDGIIDVFIQAANFTDPRGAGIVRSVYFGDENANEQSTFFSAILQVFAGTIFIVHGIFALIIYFVGIRDKAILYFSLGIFMLSLMSLNAGDEKIFLQLIYMDYTWSYKVSMIILFLISIAIIKSLERNIRQIHPKIVPVYTVILIILSILSIILPMEYLVQADPISIGAVFMAMIIAVFSLIRTSFTLGSGKVGLILALLAVINHFAWFSYTLYSGIKVMYYPFDLIIAITCLSFVWFKHYYDLNVQIRTQAEQLEKADKEKDLFLANTSHELKNPLHNILNMSTAVLDREQDNLQEDSKKDLETVLSVSKQMTMLVRDLLEMTLLRDRKPSLFIRQTSLQGIVEGVIHMNNYLLERKDVNIINEVDVDFPYVLADENRLTQIMYNLVHNAVKFTEVGRITIKADVKDGKAYIYVIDTGIGIDESMIADLFLPYKQGVKPDKAIQTGGLGLGLYITKQLVEYQSGHISVESTLGKGTTFTFTLPLAINDIVEDNQIKLRRTERLKEQESIFTQQASLLKKESLAQKRKNPKMVEDVRKVIVVDDDPVNLRVIEVVLHNDSYDVTTVLSAAEVLQLIEQEEFDIIISDVMMPHMSGFELTKKIRERFTMTEIPVLLLTARDRVDDVKHGFDVGANDYVTKPLDAVELRSRVRALTDVKSIARESLYLETAFLQAQIQPHFIFNTINSIFALSEIDIKRMQSLLEAFSDVLQSKFHFKNMKQLVPIEQELQLIEAYLYIEQVRFGDRVQVIWDVDDTIDVQIPSITIQPLVENAILHGITMRAIGGTITVRVKDVGKEIEISIEDDGVGISPEKLEQLRNMEVVGASGVGIYNTNLRLKRLYGKGLVIESEEDKGTKVSFTIPKSSM